MTAPLRVGILLPTRALLLGEERPDSIEPLLALAARAEEAGVDSLWVGDSLTAKPRLEPLTVLSALAVRTRRPRLGTAVLLGALRHPVTAAHVLGTLDVLSGGRLVMGAGVGGAFVEAQRREWRAVGIDPRDRGARFEEWVELVKDLTRGRSVSRRGRFFELDDVAIQPSSPRASGIPFLLATHWRTGGARQRRRAMRLGDGLMGISDSPDEYRRLLEALGELAVEENRDFDKMEKAFYLTVCLGEPSRAREEADAFLKQYYGINMWDEMWGPWGPPSAVVERARSYQAAGAETLLFRFASSDQERQLDTFVERVLPQLA